MGHVPTSRSTEPPRLPLVDRRAWGRGRLRHQRAALHRVGTGNQLDLECLRSAARPRVLVLLRRRSNRSVDQGGFGGHPEVVAHSTHLRATRAGRPECGSRPLEVPGLFRGIGGRRARSVCRGLSVRTPDGIRQPGQGLHDQDHCGFGPSVH